MDETITIELSKSEAMTGANLLKEHNDDHSHDYCERISNEIWDQIRA